MTAPLPRWRLVLETLALVVALCMLALLAVHGFALLVVGIGELARQMAEAAGW